MYISSQVPPTSYSGVMRNNGDGTFTPTQFPLPEIWSSSGGWIDYDGDGRLDAVISGNSRTGAIMLFYHDNYTTTNSAPTAPTGLSSTVLTNGAFLSWVASSNNLLATNSFSYNLRVGTSPAGGEILSPLSWSNGARKVMAMGNVGAATTARLANLLPGTYYWSVQTVNAGFAGSPFAPAGSFVIPGSPLVSTLAATNITSTMATIQGLVYPNGLDSAPFFLWGSTTNLGNSLSLPNLSLNSGTNLEVAQLTGLSPGAKYYFRLAATNAIGSGAGNILGFQTAGQPSISSVKFQSSSSIQLSFAGASGLQYHIYASTNLVDWVDLGTAVDQGSNSFAFTDNTATNYPARFYKIAVP